ncbi:MAG: alpha-1,2-fucosyltransferase [Acidobacteria bacterium]|nr:alpha-1,2-fucosyltransferase [Acidobacteriota bacterium]
MIVVKLMGGLGNRMFQYAFGRHLAHRHKTQLKLDLSFFLDAMPKKKHHVIRHYDLDIFNIDGIVASESEVFDLSKRVQFSLLDRALNRFWRYKKSHIVEPHFHFSVAAFNSPDDVYSNGYWQTEKYFGDVSELVRSDFSFKEALGPRAADLHQRIMDSNSVCLNVRRGDFVVNDFHGVQGVDYFARANELLRQQVVGFEYFVFSDEIEWCEANLKFDNPVTFVSHEYAGRKFQDYLRLMSAWKHFVIPNSSFAWWAVWFNQDPDRLVIAPKNWFGDSSLDTSDLIPENWLRV